MRETVCHRLQLSLWGLVGDLLHSAESVRTVHLYNYFVKRNSLFPEFHRDFSGADSINEHVSERRIYFFSYLLRNQYMHSVLGLTCVQFWSNDYNDLKERILFLQWAFPILALNCYFLVYLGWSLISNVGTPYVTLLQSVLWFKPSCSVHAEITGLLVLWCVRLSSSQLDSWETTRHTLSFCIMWHKQTIECTRTVYCPAVLHITWIKMNVYMVAYQC